MAPKSADRVKADIADVLDQYMSAYGWTLRETLKLTLYQAKEFSRRIARRVYQERVVLANLIRAAGNADRDEFVRYLESLDPDRSSELEHPSPEASVRIPEGFVVKEML